MRVINIYLGGNEDDVDHNDPDNSKEVMDRRFREEMERLERFAAQEGLEITDPDSSADELFEIFDDLLAKFGLEIVHFLYKSKKFVNLGGEYLWRIEERRS